MLRWRALVVSLAAALALASTYAVAVGTGSGQAVDTGLMDRVVAAMDEPRWARALLEVVSPLSVLLAVVALTATTLLTRGGSVAATAAGVALVTMVGAQVLKDGLPRPTLAGYEAMNSLPSGHVAVVAGLAAAAWVASSARLRPWVFVVGAPAVAVTGLATVALAWHRPSDVVAAALLAVTVAAAGSVVRPGPGGQGQTLLSRPDVGRSTRRTVGSACRSDSPQANRSTTQSTQAHRALTSSGSTLGNSPNRSWLRPSLR